MDNRLNYLNHVHSNVSSHHHRSLANTDDGALYFHCRKSQARIFSINGEGINQLKSCILKYFSGIITATLLAQLIVRLTFKSGGLEVKHQTIFFSLFFFKGEHIDQLKHVYENYSSHHHRSLASTVSSAHNFRSGGLEVEQRMVVIFFFRRGHIDELKYVYENYSSRHHRSLSSTVDSVLGFDGRGCWFKPKKTRKKKLSDFHSW